MTLNFRTDRSGQTVQTQIRLLLRSSLIRAFTVCYSLCTILTKYPKVWPLCLNFRQITAKISGVPKLRIQFTVLFVPRREKTGFLHMRKQRRSQISFAVTAKLISAFIFATRIVQSLSFLNTKFQASSHFLRRRSLICVGPGRKPRRPVF